MSTQHLTIALERLPAGISELTAVQCAWLRGQLDAAGIRPSARHIAGLTWSLVGEDGYEVRLVLPVDGAGGAGVAHVTVPYRHADATTTQEAVTLAPTPERRSNGGRAKAAALLANLKTRNMEGRR